MMRIRLWLKVVTVLAIFALPLYKLNAQGQATRSGSTWTGKVDGSVVYTGSRMFECINTVCNNMDEGTINILNSGDSGEDGGSVYAIKPKSGQTLDFRGHTVNCNSSGDLVVAVYADRKSNITVKDIIVKGNPRYAFWFRGCSDVTFTDITMELDDDSPVGLGIRYDASTASASNLTINGDIDIDGCAGHAIETYTVGGVEIGDVTVTNTGGCGVLLNDSWDCNVGVVTGKNNCPDGGYATFRVANANENTYCAGVYSRNSGRGFFSVTESEDCTVEWVDVDNTNRECIYIQDSYNTHVLHGETSNCGNGNLIRGGSGNSINLDGTTSSVSAVALSTEHTLKSAGGTVDNPPSDEEAVSVYPNPAESFVTVDLPNLESQYASVSVFNEQGKLVYTSKNLVKGENRLSLEGFPSGIYMVKILDGTDVTIRHIVVK